MEFVTGQSSSPPPKKKSQICRWRPELATTDKHVDSFRANDRWHFERFRKGVFVDTQFERDKSGARVSCTCAPDDWATDLADGTYVRPGTRPL